MEKSRKPHVYIAFMPRWERPMRDGEKIVTTRTSVCAGPGDTFVAFGMIFKITGVTRATPFVVARDYYQEEGCQSRREFEQA